MVTVAERRELIKASKLSDDKSSILDTFQNTSQHTHKRTQVCYHGFFAFMIELYSQHPGANISSALAHFKDVGGFIWQIDHYQVRSDWNDCLCSSDTVHGVETAYKRLVRDTLDQGVYDTGEYDRDTQWWGRMSAGRGVA